MKHNGKLTQNIDKKNHAALMSSNVFCPALITSKHLPWFITVIEAVLDLSTGRKHFYLVEEEYFSKIRFILPT